MQIPMEATKSQLITCCAEQRRPLWLFARRRSVSPLGSPSGAWARPETQRRLNFNRYNTPQTFRIACLLAISRVNMESYLTATLVGS